MYPMLNWHQFHWLLVICTSVTVHLVQFMVLALTQIIFHTVYAKQERLQSNIKDTINMALHAVTSGIGVGHLTHFKSRTIYNFTIKPDVSVEYFGHLLLTRLWTDWYQTCRKVGEGHRKRNIL